jgi:hypothetical protein
MRRPGLAGVGAGSFVNVTVKRVARKTVSVARVAAVACARDKGGRRRCLAAAHCRNLSAYRA